MKSVSIVFNLTEIAWYVRNHMLKARLVIMLELYTRICGECIYFDIVRQLGIICFNDLEHL